MVLYGFSSHIMSSAQLSIRRLLYLICLQVNITVVGFGLRLCGWGFWEVRWHGFGAAEYARNAERQEGAGKIGQNLFEGMLPAFGQGTWCKQMTEMAHHRCQLWMAGQAKDLALRLAIINYIIVGRSFDVMYTCIWPCQNYLYIFIYIYIISENSYQLLVVIVDL